MQQRPRKFQRRELSVDDLYDTLIVKRREQEGRLSQRFGYVPMDTFWLLAAEGTHSRALSQLVEKMDDHTLRNYIYLLPTLGQRSVPILLELLNRITSDSSCGYKVSLIRKALVNIARQEKVELRDEITELLDTSCRFQQSVAIAMLEAFLSAIRPEATVLLANYPNPFNPETWIPYELATASDVRITIYDMGGVVVRRLELGHQASGYYTSRSRAAYWDGRNAVGERVASGIYFYQLQADNTSLVRKMVILK